MSSKALGQAGTLESCDALVMVLLDAGKEGIVLEMDGPSLVSFEEDIRVAVSETLASLGISDAEVRLSERGALDCTLRARVEAAARRALAVLEKAGVEG
jgi:citrate lyase subunit gamma (acyl carrier protein)